MATPRSTDDPIALPFHAQVALVGRLVEANTVRAALAKPHWDDWFDRIAKLPVEAQSFFPQQAESVRSIQAAAAEIAAERGQLPVVRDAVMDEKIRQLAMASANSGLSLGERIANDFAAFRKWRKDHLDGVDCDMFSLVDHRNLSARPRGERRPLFDALFVSWAKTAGIPLREAEAAARAKRQVDIELAEGPSMPTP